MTKPKTLPDPGRQAIESKSRLGLDNRPAIRALDKRWALGGLAINPNNASAGAPPPPKYRPWSAATLKYRAKMDSTTAAIVDRGNRAVPDIHDPTLRALEV